MSDEHELMPRQEPFPETPAERLTRQFYEWEARGRGWQLWPYAVELEPPFRPFIYHYVPQGSPVDDGRRPTLLGSLAEGVQGLFTSRKQAPATAIEEYLQEEEPLPEVFVEQGQVAEFSVALPKGMSWEREDMCR